jgi:hypothetical protein
LFRCNIEWLFRVYENLLCGRDVLGSVEVRSAMVRCYALRGPDKGRHA